MTDPALEFKSPVRFRFGQRVTLAVAPPITALALKAIYRTCRVENFDEHWWHEYHPSRQFLGGFWHESLAMVLCRFRGTGYATLTSYSFDGELAARVVKQFGSPSLRGSSSRGGLKALAQLTLATQTSRGLGFTLDGPRGPRRVAKPGLAFLSARTQLPVLTVAAHATPAWRLNSWDRLQIPKPFCTVRFAFGDPIPPPPSTERGDVEAMRVRIESKLNALHARLECDAKA